MTEVLNRLPQETKDKREFRYKRAFQLSIQKNYLEKEEWTKPEEDKPYLRHILAEVRAEQEERAAFDFPEGK